MAKIDFITTMVVSLEINKTNFEQFNTTKYVLV